ncbi:MAG: hypothetical protein Q8R44_14845 [Novosphingobium sp.]|nr:hypothetical protein [Novosphingobium sp.]
MKAPFVSALLSLTLACANPTGLIGGHLAVQAAPPVLELTNQSPASIYSFTIERDAAAYTDWAPCNDPARCSPLRPGASMAVPYTQIAGYASGASEAIVYWWHLIAGGETGFRPDSIRAVVVAL